MADLYTALLIAAAFTNLSLLFILIRRPERSTVINSFALFIVAITIWGVPQIIINWFGLHREIYEYFDRISALGYIAFPIVFFVFSLAFTKKLSYLKNVFLSFYLFVPGLIFLYLSWTTNLIDNHSQEAIVINQWGYNSQTGEFFVYYLLWLESLMIASMGILIAYYFSVKNYVQKKQLILLIIAVLIPLVLGSITDGVLPMFGIHIFPAAVPLTTFMAIIISYAIMRYDLFDIEAYTILSSIGEGVVYVNKKGIIGNSNNALSDIFKIHPSELTGKKIYSFIKSQTPNEERRFLNSISKGKKFSSSNFFFNYQKKKIPVSVSVAPIEINKKIMGSTIIVKDIREEIKREETKDEFISIASHELKTPITSIKLYSDILAAKLSNKAPEYQFVIKLRDQVNQLLALTNDLLDLSRLRTGDINLNTERFNLSEILEEAVDTFRKTHPEREIILSNRINRDVVADKARITQVIANLINNALKYSEKNKKVVVSAKIEGGKALLSIKDYGQGIPKHEQNKVFNRYYQIDCNGGNHQSLGIGLYVSANIVKKHKGKIWIKSKEKKGSTFFFTLPLAGKEHSFPALAQSQNA